MQQNIQALSQDELEKALSKLEGWDFISNSIKKEFKFSSYMLGIDFVMRGAKFAEKIQHHPEIIINYKRVTVILTTHDAGNKVSTKDILSAKELNYIASEL